MMPDWAVTTDLYLEKTIIQEKKRYRNSTFVCKKIDNSQRIKDENKSYFLIVGLVKLNGDSG